jgi:uncharacterized hydrophobic protein (TIGR00271 family)
MLQLRVYCPEALGDDVVRALEQAPGVGALGRVSGASVRPPGDIITATVARTSADAILDLLSGLGLAQDGSIELSPIAALRSSTDLEAVNEVTRDDADAVVWDEVVGQAYESSALTWGYFAFITMATIIAAIAILLDSQVLVIGAMVLGPEFGAVAALGIALVMRRPHLLVRAARTLLIGFATAIAITTALTAMGRLSGLVTESMATGPRPFTQFIYEPNIWSLFVAVVAGVAGVLALATDRSTSLTGVFISVTTIPAAGNIAVALPFGNWAEVTGSALQLAINICGMAIAGWLTLVILRRASWTPSRATAA